MKNGWFHFMILKSFISPPLPSPVQIFSFFNFLNPIPFLYRIYVYGIYIFTYLIYKWAVVRCHVHEININEITINKYNCKQIEQDKFVRYF